MIHGLKLEKLAHNLERTVAASVTAGNSMLSVSFLYRGADMLRLQALIWLTFLYFKDDCIVVVRVRSPCRDDDSHTCGLVVP